MKVLVVGSGGREHALVWKLSQEPKIGALFCAPGNGGISSIAECVDIDATDTVGLLAFAKRELVDLVVVGPETALAAGVVDVMQQEGVQVFGPSKRGSQLETSKVFTKNLLKKHGIPTAPFKVFDEYREAQGYLDTLSPPYVVKADGLCAGKGAFVVKEKAEGDAALRELMVENVYGKAGRRVVIETFLHGTEASYLAFADGVSILPMIPAQDHKALLDGDEGPNTGGMGAYAPIPFVDTKSSALIDHLIMEKTLEGLREEGITYKGVLYAGLMMDGHNPSVIEFNARFGDPETQPILFKMDSDLLPILSACSEGTLKEVSEIGWKSGVALCVVLASRGYPGKPENGHLIRGLDDLKGQSDVFVFHAGTKRIGDNYYTAGGRVLGVTVIGDSCADAVARAYDAVSCIHFEGMYYRTDIGRKALLDEM
jgi:phosphoribosylamine---glycine ligase